MGLARNDRNWHMQLIFLHVVYMYKLNIYTLPWHPFLIDPKLINLTEIGLLSNFIIFNELHKGVYCQTASGNITIWQSSLLLKKRSTSLFYKYHSCHYFVTNTTYGIIFIGFSCSLSKHLTKNTALSITP